jgi:hypothetical protein
MSYKIGDSGPDILAFDQWLNRKFAAYAGIKEDGKYGLEEARVVAEAMRRYNLAPTFMDITVGGQPMHVEGAVATDEFLHRAAWTLQPPPQTRKHRYEIQGVGGDSRAFLNPPDAPSFEKDTNRFSIEGNRLTPLIRPPIVPIGYSMGGVSVCKYLNSLTPAQRSLIGAVITFGDPSMPTQGSLLGDDPGEGISKTPQPQWCWDRYYSFSIDGDWYPRARGLLFLLYQVLQKAELTADFAWYLFTKFPAQAMQQLMGLQPSDDPLAGVLGPIAGVLTTGPANTVGNLLGPAQIVLLLPQLIELLFDAVKFMQSQAHSQYGNPDYALWDGMTGVDKAVQIIKERLPGGCTTLLFPGTWSNWDQLFQFDVAIRLYNEGGLI